MANPRRTSTRRAILSYDRLKQLTEDSGAKWSDLLIKDYQGILQDFISNADGVDDIQNSHYPDLSSQTQWLQQQIDGLPEFTMDTEGFTMDTTNFTMDKVTA